MPSNLSLYRSLIEASGADIVDSGFGKKMVVGHPEVYERACDRFGEVPMVYLEFWHNGGCDASGLSNHAVACALTEAGWKGDVVGKGHDDHLSFSRCGEATNEWFTLYRSDSKQTGFNLRAPALFLPSSTEDEDDVAAGTNLLKRIILDLLAVRTLVPTVILEAAKSIAACEDWDVEEVGLAEIVPSANLAKWEPIQKLDRAVQLFLKQTGVGERDVERLFREYKRKEPDYIKAVMEEYGVTSIKKLVKHVMLQHRCFDTSLPPNFDT